MYRVILFLISIVSINSYQQSNISGVINDYAEVNSINYSTNTIAVTSSIGFSTGDKILIIQMQGAQIDESQSASFGNIDNYNNSGNYEIAEICGISGNDIIAKSPLENTYDPSGIVQLVRIPVYDNALITGSDLTALPWDGSMGGILILEVNGTLDFGSQNIDVSNQGFRGGNYLQSGAGCPIFSDDLSYYTNQTSTDERALKGEGIALSISGKECGRGPQANGGGGGNNHNAGGSGGANYGEGGAGGERIPSGAFTCGSDIGANSIDLVNGYNTNKIFMGGGGGTGHGNGASPTGCEGNNGGGIVIIIADNIEGNNQNILANGSSGTANSFSDGGGGGGAGGTILLNVNTYNSSLNAYVEGGFGASVDNVGTSNCSGPGGGGGGGLIYLSNTTGPSNLNTFTNGGSAGIIATTSQSNCNVGSNNNAVAGQNGGLLFNLSISNNSSISNISISECESYTVPSGDETYTVNGSYYDTIPSINGCDSILFIDLTINTGTSSTITHTQCNDYLVPSGDETYSVSGIYQDTISNSMGCDSIITIDLTISPIDTSVIQNGNILTVSTIFTTYQWIDCDLNSTISGETNQEFIAQYNGNFAVILFDGSCTDTSACYHVNNVGIHPETINKINIYPNPTTGLVHIGFYEICSICKIDIYNSIGEQIFTNNYYNKSEVDIDIDEKPGVYVMRIWIDNQVRNVRIIVE